MTTKTLDFGCELKATGDTGTFEGYGSVFNITDRGGDIVAAGAFAETLAAAKAAGRLPAMLWQHRQAEPIGVYTEMEEDSIGLKVKGKLALKTARGAEAYELMKMGAISGLSIGYRVRDDSWDRVTGVRTIKKADLHELSLVTMPMNDASRVSAVKTIEELDSLSEIERHLRDACGLSKSEATAMVSRIKSVSRSDSGDREPLAADFAASLKARAVF
ncbi:HK97 family phage prohead protease [Acidovorax radicis]|uniref:HK97 family phage prohead protease n=1 Tax=Acidovorax radicis TaxID=758826 RepID=UPI001CFB8F11|nr:HK97 family phage prohead protease [Acidovorax radicis]UCV00289.1 HK97 family phage prohead protease [Acidovorax radicis]